MDLQAPAKWLASTGISCAVWLRMSDAAKREWVATRRFGNPQFLNSAIVGSYVTKIDLVCGASWARPLMPAAQVAAPVPAPTESTASGIGTLVIYVGAGVGIIALAFYLATKPNIRTDVTERIRSRRANRPAGD
jgi:hypothetical protein